MYRYVQHLMNPLQAVGSEGIALEGLLPKEVVNKLEKMKTSTNTTHEWLQGVGYRGDIMIKDILETCGDAHRSFQQLQNLLGQDKTDVDLLLQKTKTIMDYTKEKLVSDGILSSSKVVEPLEWYEALQIMQKFLMIIHKQGQQMRNALNDIYNKCISVFEIMTGRKKFAPKHLNLEKLRKL